MLDFLETESPDGFTIDRSVVGPIGPDNPLCLYDIRNGVMGLRFKFDEDAFSRAQFLLNAPEGAAYRVILVPKDDAKINKRGNCVIDNAQQSTNWNLFVPVSDRFEYSPESLHYINVTLLAQIRVTSHAHALHVQYGGQSEYSNAAFGSSFNVIIHDSFEQARALVDNGLQVLVPSDSPAGIELLEEPKEATGEEEREDQTDS